MLTAKEEFLKKIQIAHSKMQIPTANQNAHSKTKSPQQNEKSTAKENHDPQHQDEAGQVAWLQLPRVGALFLYGGPVLMHCFNCGSVVSENSNFCASCGRGKCFLRVIDASSRSFLFLSMFQCD